MGSQNQHGRLPRSSTGARICELNASRGIFGKWGRKKSHLHARQKKARNGHAPQPLGSSKRWPTTVECHCCGLRLLLPVNTGTCVCLSLRSVGVSVCLCPSQTVSVCLCQSLPVSACPLSLLTCWLWGAKHSTLVEARDEADRHCSM